MVGLAQETYRKRVCVRRIKSMSTHAHFYIIMVVNSLLPGNQRPLAVVWAIIG